MTWFELLLLPENLLWAWRKVRRSYRMADCLYDQAQVAGFELDLEALAACESHALKVAALPRFPAVVRDISVLVADTIAAEEMRATIRAAAPPALVGRVALVVAGVALHRPAGASAGQAKGTRMSRSSSPDGSRTVSRATAGRQRWASRAGRCGGRIMG